MTVSLAVAAAWGQDATYLWLPAGLVVYYLIAWLIVGRPLPQGHIVPQYAPPAGMSPAEVRYLLTGSTDRKTVAAVLVHLAAQKLISVSPENGDYRITLAQGLLPGMLPPEEAAAMRAIAEVQSFADLSRATVDAQTAGFLLRPAQRQHVNLIGSVISGTVNARVEKACFVRNLRYSALAFTISFLKVMAMAARFEDHGNGVFFLTLWLMFCSVVVGVITAMNVLPMVRDALQGRIGGLNVWTALVPLLIFGGVMGFVDWRIAKGSNPAFAWLLVAVVVLNVGFGIALKRLTPEGRKRLDQILGFREFLATVELDRLDRMNNPHLVPALLNDYLAYAIALDLKEAWGDHFGNALFSASATSAG
jgi:hypothetical protein